MPIKMTTKMRNQSNDNTHQKKLTASLAASLLATIGVTALSTAQADDAEDITVYSARKEELIKPLLDQFSEQSGVEVNLITGNYGDLQKRLEVEGSATPADVYITVDAGRLQMAKAAGLFQPIESEFISENVPAENFDVDRQWVSLSERARPVYLAKEGSVKPEDIKTYADLADPKFEGKLCIRSSANIYNQSLMASILHHEGEAAAQAWAEGIVNNMARKPTGGDTDQILAVAAGQCDIAVANHYYYARLLNSDNPDDVAEAKKVILHWVNQGEDQRGNHINVSGAGITKASDNPEQALALIEFLLSPDAQTWYAETNNEYPVMEEGELSEELQRLGEFKADELNLSILGELNAEAVRIMDRAGWQ